MLKQLILGAVAPIETGNADPGAPGNHRDRCVTSFHRQHFLRRLQERFVVSLGAHYVDYSRPGWTEAARGALARQGVVPSLDVVFDGVGGDVGTQAAALLLPEGGLSLYGVASGSETAIAETQPVRTTRLSAAPTPAQAVSLITEALEHAAAATAGLRRDRGRVTGSTRFTWSGIPAPIDPFTLSQKR